MNRGSVFISLTSGGSDIMRNSYQYDAVDNILGISNNVNPQGLTQQNKAKLGGNHTHSYQYDELNRLIQMNTVLCSFKIMKNKLFSDCLTLTN